MPSARRRQPRLSPESREQIERQHAAALRLHRLAEGQANLKLEAAIESANNALRDSLDIASKQSSGSSRKAAILAVVAAQRGLTNSFGLATEQARHRAREISRTQIGFEARTVN